MVKRLSFNAGTCHDPIDPSYVDTNSLTAPIAGGITLLHPMIISSCYLLKAPKKVIFRNCCIFQQSGYLLLTNIGRNRQDPYLSFHFLHKLFNQQWLTGLSRIIAHASNVFMHCFVWAFGSGMLITTLCYSVNDVHNNGSRSLEFLLHLNESWYRTLQQHISAAVSWPAAAAIAPARSRDPGLRDASTRDDTLRRGGEHPLQGARWQHGRRHALHQILGKRQWHERRTNGF